MQVITNALRVVECVIENQPIGVSEISRRLGVHKASVQRSLIALEENGWVARDRFDVRKWIQTPRVWVLAHSGRGLEIRELTGGVLRWINELTDENVHVTRQEGDSLVVVDKLDSTKVIRVHDPIGNRVPLHLSGSGRAMLATWSSSQIDGYIDRHQSELESSPDLAAQRLLAGLNEIRDRGYAVNRGSWRPEVSGVSTALPLAGANAVAEYALAISIPTHRLDKGKIKWYADLVLEARSQVMTAAGVADGTRES